MTSLNTYVIVRDGYVDRLSEGLDTWSLRRCGGEREAAAELTAKSKERLKAANLPVQEDLRDFLEEDRVLSQPQEGIPLTCGVLGFYSDGLTVARDEDDLELRTLCTIFKECKHEADPIIGEDDRISCENKITGIVFKNLYLFVVSEFFERYMRDVYCNHRQLNDVDKFKTKMGTVIVLSFDAESG